MMAYLGAVLLAAVCVLAARGYFGKKYEKRNCGGCEGCPRAANCGRKAARRH